MGFYFQVWKEAGPSSNDSFKNFLYLHFVKLHGVRVGVKPSISLCFCLLLKIESWKWKQTSLPKLEIYECFPHMPMLLSQPNIWKEGLLREPFFNLKGLEEGRPSDPFTLIFLQGGQSYWAKRFQSTVYLSWGGLGFLNHCSNLQALVLWRYGRKRPLSTSDPQAHRWRQREQVEPKA